MSDSIREFRVGSGVCFSQDGLEFREGVFDRIVVGTIWRKEQHARAACFDCLAGSHGFVSWQIVEDDAVARTQRWRQTLLGIGGEPFPPHTADLEIGISTARDCVRQSVWILVVPVELKNKQQGNHVKK